MSAGRVLVVGHGFLGRNVAGALADRDVRVLSRSPAPGAEGVDVVVGDAAEPAVLDAALDGVAHVVFAAGGLLPDALERRPETGLVYLSSGGTVYGDSAPVPTGEDHPPSPRGSYGRVRLACEREIADRRAAHGLRTRILRCSTVYGEHQAPDRGQGAVATFLRRVAAGEAVTLFGDGGAVRDYVYALDVGRAVAAMLGRAGGPLIVNLGSGVGTTLLELLALVEAEVGCPARIDWRPRRPFDVRVSVLDITRLRDLVPFAPTPLAEGIRVTSRWLGTSAGEPGAVA